MTIQREHVTVASISCFVSLCLIVLLLVGCRRRISDVDLSQWDRGDTLWTSPSGTVAASYHDHATLGRDSQLIVCESRPKKVLRLIPPDAFPLISGSTVNVYSLKDRTTEGWYKITRNHKLNWWQRNIYTDESLGGWELLRAPPDIPMPDAKTLHNSVFALSSDHLKKVADESKFRELFEVPVEGIVYVGEPGIGVRDSIDLKSECP